MKLFMILCLLFILLHNLISAIPRNRLLGGRRDYNPLLSSVVKLEIYQPNKTHAINSYTCTGTIISKDLILSAGHCFFSMVFGFVYVMIDGQKKLDTFNSYTITDWEITPEAKNEFVQCKSVNFDYDLAVAKVTPEFDLDCLGITPGKLKTSLEPLPIPSNLTIGGFGRNEKNILGEFSWGYVETTDCKADLFLKVICYDKTKTGCCAMGGDSGAPAFDKDDYLVGVNSGLGIKKYGTQDLGYFVNVAENKDFIENAIKKLNSIQAFPY